MFQFHFEKKLCISYTILVGDYIVYESLFISSRIPHSLVIIGNSVDIWRKTSFLFSAQMNIHLYIFCRKSFFVGAYINVYKCLFKIVSIECLNEHLYIFVENHFSFVLIWKSVDIGRTSSLYVAGAYMNICKYV